MCGQGYSKGWTGLSGFDLDVLREVSGLEGEVRDPQRVVSTAVTDAQPRLVLGLLSRVNSMRLLNGADAYRMLTMHCKGCAGLCEVRCVAFEVECSKSCGTSDHKQSKSCYVRHHLASAPDSRLGQKRNF